MGRSEIRPTTAGREMGLANGLGTPRQHFHRHQRPSIELVEGVNRVEAINDGPKLVIHSAGLRNIVVPGDVGKPTMWGHLHGEDTSTTTSKWCGAHAAANPRYAPDDTRDRRPAKA